VRRFLWNFVAFGASRARPGDFILTEDCQGDSSFAMEIITNSHRKNGDGAEIPPGGRELAFYVKDMLSSLRRCAGAPYFANLRALLLLAENEAEHLTEHKDTERRWQA
jgi:hypothetical protein